jgi:hypothetical protein
MVEEEEESDIGSDEDNSNSEEVKEERDQLNKLGVSDTWDILTKPGTKKKEEKKPAFRGFQ